MCRVGGRGSDVSEDGVASPKKTSVDHFPRPLRNDAMDLMETPLNPPLIAKVISPETARQARTLEGICSYLKWVYRRGDLIRVVCYSELKQTIIRSKLSYLWWLMDPLFDTLCYVFLVEAIGRGGGGKVPYPLFILTAITPWRWSTGCWIGSTKLWTQYRALINQLRFPYMALIYSRFLHELILYLISYVVLFGACIAYGYYPRTTWLLLPVVILVHAIVVLALMFFFSVLSFYFADLERILPFLLRLWFYSSPVLYGLEHLSPGVQTAMLFNPMAPIFLNYRGCVLYGQVPDWTQLGVYVAVFLVFLILGMLIFIRKEPHLTRYV
jgi:ABC-type polysaccharide/polyol phosphate export permease